MKNKFKILDRGNFYFPFIDREKEFIVDDAIEITLDKKDKPLVEECLKCKAGLFFGMLAEAIWNALKELDLNQHKNCWFVPVYLYKLGKDYICSIDILKRVESKTRNRKKNQKKLRNQKRKKQIK